MDKLKEELEEMLQLVNDDLSKCLKNKSAALRVRTNSIKLQNLFKAFRKKSVSFHKN